MHITGEDILFCRQKQTLILICFHFSFQIQYEERIRDLEAQLHLYRRPDDNSLKEYDHPHTSTLAVQRELDSVRDKYKKQVTELQAEITKLNNELNKTKTSQEGIKNDNIIFY